MLAKGSKQKQQIPEVLLNMDRVGSGPFYMVMSFSGFPRELVAAIGWLYQTIEVPEIFRV
jgi:hypothetical protein